MDKRELLAMLATRGVDPFNIPGGKANITAHDVSAMMVHCTPFETALLRAKYVGDSMPEALEFWYRKLKAENWRKATYARVFALARLTLLEHISNRCGICEGRGGWMVGSTHQVCPGCDGRGSVAISNRAVSKLLDLGDQGLKEPWLSRLDWCRKTLTSVEDGAIAKMR